MGCIRTILSDLLFEQANESTCHPRLETGGDNSHPIRGLMVNSSFVITFYGLRRPGQWRCQRSRKALAQLHVKTVTATSIFP